MLTKQIYRVFGILAFVNAFVTYFLTAQPSVPFWDCGEFSAASIWQQVPHPPGAPLFLLVGKIFYDLLPFFDPGFRLNLVSVTTSAVTIGLLYLITVKVIKNFRSEKVESLGDALAVYGSALIGALAFTYSDTFWFNAVESEVYAASSVFVAIIIYLMMRWNEKAEEPGNEKYLLLIAYLIGLSTGVHLLSILTIFSLVLLVYFRKYKLSVLSLLITIGISLVAFFVVYPLTVKWIPALLASHSPMKTDAREYLIDDNPLMTLLALGLIVAAAIGLWKGLQKKLPILNLICTSFLLMIIGYTTYTQVMIRSNSNSPMNENEPKNLTKLTSYLGREQYGEAPNWPRRYQIDEYYTRNYEKKDESGNYVYGKWIAPSRKEVQRKDGSYMAIADFKKTNVAGELAYLFKYQIQHMYLRYFYWNFVGRKSDMQDADEAWFDKKGVDELNYESGYAYLFPVRFFALPLLFGLIGIMFHFWRDPKMATVYLLMFLMMGVLATIQQNQQEPQPRERDYFYAGSFMVFCIWIALGTYGLIDWIGKKKFIPSIAGSVVVGSILLVPINMAVGGWKMHSRAGNYIPFDYSYNILQSTERDAILFTNGDNDTFPLWFLQDVEGVRRDVRVVNLSLGNTLWYIDQLKNREPWGAKKIPLSFADDSLRVDETDPKALTYDMGEAQNITIPVPPEIMKQYTNDPELLASSKMSFRFVGKNYGKRDDKTMYMFRVQDKLVLDIMRNVRFTRPVYFSVTVGQEVFCGLDNYLRYEGMAMRVCPVPQKGTSADPIEINIMHQCLMNVDNSNDFKTEPAYGFKMRNLNNMSVYYDDVHRRLIRTYRHLYVTLAANYLEDKKDKQLAIACLDKMDENISKSQFPMTFDLFYKIAKIYQDAGAADKARQFADLGIKACMELVNNQRLSPEYIYYEISGRSYGPYRIAALLYEMIDQYDPAMDVLRQLVAKTEELKNRYGGNPSYSREIQKIEYSIMDIKANIDELRIEKLVKEFGAEKAIDSANKIYQGYVMSSNPVEQMMARYIRQKINEIELRTGKSSSTLTEESTPIPVM